MARKVTAEDIKQFNELYFKYKSYAEVARQTGWSASTISKYVDKNYHPVVQTEVKRFNREDLPEFSTELFEGVANLGEVCVYSTDEMVEIVTLWEEIAI